jgi:hypothetical protein
MQNPDFVKSGQVVIFLHTTCFYIEIRTTRSYRDSFINWGFTNCINIPARSNYEYVWMHWAVSIFQHTFTADIYACMWYICSFIAKTNFVLLLCVLIQINIEKYQSNECTLFKILFKKMNVAIVLVQYFKLE